MTRFPFGHEAKSFLIDNGYSNEPFVFHISLFVIPFFVGLSIFMFAELLFRFRFRFLFRFRFRFRFLILFLFLFFLVSGGKKN